MKIDIDMNMNSRCYFPMENVWQCGNLSPLAGWILVKYSLDDTFMFFLKHWQCLSNVNGMSKHPPKITPASALFPR